MSDNLPVPGGEFLLYATDDGRARLTVRVQDGAVWLSQAAMAELFRTTKQNVSLHLQNIYEEEELRPEATVKQYLTVQTEGGRQVRRLIDHYNLDAILAVGYRVRSIRGTQFRQWATAQLRELLVKGFVLDDEKLKGGETAFGDYFDELLARIRDIRASERRFYQKTTTSTPPASTTTRRPRSPRTSTPRCRTSCTGPSTATPPPRSSRGGPTPRSRTWG